MTYWVFLVISLYGYDILRQCTMRRKKVSDQVIPFWKGFNSQTREKVMSWPSILNGNQERKIILSGGLEDGKEVTVLTTKGIDNLTGLQSNHEVVDTWMILHAIRQPTERVIYIRSPNTDVLVLAVHCFRKMEDVKELWFETGTCTSSWRSNIHHPSPWDLPFFGR